ncbi:bifunctional diaminohydroxyphosphoribosylaminopyrimidine deaminase/5-amino-6-(5-phosphoribosylamino)uracil reductase [soil metagenome]
MRLLTKLYESPALPAYDLPPALAQLHDGPLGFGEAKLVANFVSSIDGVVALRSVPASPSLISGRSEADRFMMGLLRACAGTVLVGASTLRAEPEHKWTPAYIYPRAADDFAELRRRLGLPPEPQLAVLTRSGDIDPRSPALHGALVLTGELGARRLDGRLAADTTLLRVAGADDGPAMTTVVDAVRSSACPSILSEGGPNLMGQLAREGLVDELFLTLSPLLIGRTEEGRRPGLVDGADLLQPAPVWSEVLSVRRSDSHLFLRYLLSR